MKLFDLTGKTALVTGASRGLGRGMALALAEAGADVAVAARTGPKLREVATQIERMGRRARAFPVDLSAREAPAELVRATREAFGAVDILVTAAAVQVRKPALEVTYADWDYLINTNLRAVYFLCQEAARVMIEQGGGKIINVASLTSVIGWPLVSIYAASKGGVAQLTKTLALEWAPYNIHVNAIGPGSFHTELTDAMYKDPVKAERIVRRIPLGRPGIPEDLAGVTVFLASKASDYVTGQVFYVDGGFLSAGPDVGGAVQAPKREAAK